MKRSSVFVAAALCYALLPSAFADFPVRQGPNKETLPAVAYNSTDHEYLAVWTEEFMFDAIVATSVKGQRVVEDGSMLGEPFTIAPFAAYPTVAYNPHLNEFVVAGTNYGNIVAQRISSSGALVGSQAMLIAGAAKARIVCNSITGEYLVVGVVQTSPPPGANLQFYSSKVSADLHTVSAPELLLSWVSGGMAQSQPPGSVTTTGTAAAIAENLDIAIAYAPIQSTETPAGRYLLVLGPGVDMRMLDSDGAVINVLHDVHSGMQLPQLPFSTGYPSGGEFNVDVAYGWGPIEDTSGPAFLIVWSDKNNEWVGYPWSGIWGGYVDAAKLVYNADDLVPDRSFPISSVSIRLENDTLVAQWRPQVTYNPSSQMFFTVWRETPTDHWHCTRPGRPTSDVTA